MANDAAKMESPSHWLADISFTACLSKYRGRSLRCLLQALRCQAKREEERKGERREEERKGERSPLHCISEEMVSEVAVLYRGLVAAEWHSFRHAFCIPAAHIACGVA